MSNLTSGVATFELALPDKSLDGTLYLAASCKEYLDDGFIEGLGNSLMFSVGHKPPIHYAQGRNYYIQLPRPVSVFDTLQVAGGGNSDIGIRSNGDIGDGLIVLRDGDRSRVIDPPSEDSGLFTSTTTYFENGEFESRENVNPVGSYSSVSAQRKIETTKAVAEILNYCESPVVTPRYIGKFEYDIKDQNDEPQTAILLLVPNGGRRLDRTLTMPLVPILTESFKEGLPEFEKEVEIFYRELVYPRLLSVGAGLAKVHIAGLNHNQPTGGNVDALAISDGRWLPYITDWDTMTRPRTEDAATAQAVDLCVLIGTCATMLFKLYELGAIDEEFALDLIGTSAVQLLMGYSGKKPGELLERIQVSELLHVSDVTATLNGKTDIVHSWLD